MTNHRRTSRHQSEETKQKISESLKRYYQIQGGQTPAHRYHLSMALRRYWETID